jgi:hypothetical protein
MSHKSSNILQSLMPGQRKHLSGERSDALIFHSMQFQNYQQPKQEEDSNGNGTKDTHAILLVIPVDCLFDITGVTPTGWKFGC